MTSDQDHPAATENGDLDIGFAIVVLRERIRTGDLPLGHQLTDTDLCDGYGLSLTAARQVMKVLHAEGLVENRAGDGAFVTELPPVVMVYPGDQVLTFGETTLIYSDGRLEIYPAGTFTIRDTPRE